MYKRIVFKVSRQVCSILFPLSPPLFSLTYDPWTATSSRNLHDEITISSNYTHPPRYLNRPIRHNPRSPTIYRLHTLQAHPTRLTHPPRQCELRLHHRRGWVFGLSACQPTFLKRINFSCCYRSWLLRLLYGSQVPCTFCQPVRFLGRH